MGELESFLGTERIAPPPRQFDDNFQQVIAPPEKQCIWRDFALRGESYDPRCYECNGQDRRCGNYQG